MNVKVSNVNTPDWKALTVQANIPKELSKLEEMSKIYGGHGIPMHIIFSEV